MAGTVVGFHEVIGSIPSAIIFILNKIIIHYFISKDMTQNTIRMGSWWTLPSPEMLRRHAWQAIEYGLELLKKGIIWRIGDGAKVRIWRDPWIPRDQF